MEENMELIFKKWKEKKKQSNGHCYEPGVIASATTWKWTSRWPLKFWLVATGNNQKKMAPFPLNHFF